MNVLVVDDDKVSRTVLVNSLTKAGFNVESAANGRQAWELLDRSFFPIVLTDWMMPEIDGLQLCRLIRDKKTDHYIYVILVTGREQKTDIVTGLEFGADDYLTKPFAFEELLARLEVLVNRNNKSDERVTKLTSYDLALDLLSRDVTRGGEPIDLQAREFKLLEYLLSHKGQVVTRTMLLEHVWDYNFDPQTNIIDVHISRLRQKIDKNHERAIIQTVRGAGYIVPAES